eukprot:scaffold267858_cov32-Tisochrysis_lutea.AAC.1
MPEFTHVVSTLGIAASTTPDHSGHSYPPDFDSLWRAKAGERFGADGINISRLERLPVREEELEQLSAQHAVRKPGPLTQPGWVEVWHGVGPEHTAVRCPSEKSGLGEGIRSLVACVGQNRDEANHLRRPHPGL